jgi:hypothetical protein
VAHRVQRARAMLRLVAIVAIVPGCALYFGDDPGEPAGGGPIVDGGAPPDLEGSFSLVKTRSLAGEYPIVGVDTDRAGGVWVAYQVRSGDYYAPDTTRVVHLDANGTKTKEFVYTDEYTNVSGLAFSGDAVWLNYGNWDATSGNHHVRKLDPETGARIGSFGTPNGIIDLDVHGDELRLSYEWNQLIGLDLATGGETWRVSHELFDPGGTQRGIASTADGKLWVASWWTSRIYLLDDSFHVIGSGRTPLLEQGHTIDVGLHLAWDGAQLIMSVDGQLHWLSPR